MGQRTREVAGLTEKVWEEREEKAVSFRCSLAGAEGRTCIAVLEFEDE
jgi:hypothetical protein